MGKIPQSSNHLNSNPNLKPAKKQKQRHNGGGYNNNDDSPAVIQTASDDAYSFNQTNTSRSSANYGRYLSFDVASFTKSELIELRERLSGELEQIRDLQNRICSGRFSNSGNPRTHAKFNKPPGNERSVSAIGSVPDRPSNGSSKSNLNAVDLGELLTECRQIVVKLLKPKMAYIFKAPVDVVRLGLHDYHHIVKNPMDLGTVRTKLAKNLYPSPVEFADDVRLTFNNAMLYNPKSNPVHGLAMKMLSDFEELFRPIQAKIDSYVSQRREKFRDLELDEELNGNSRNKLIQKTAKQKVSARKNERMQRPMQAHSSASTSSNPPPPISNQQKQEHVRSPVRAPNLPLKEQKSARIVPQVKQPKPKAMDACKREMTMDEKHKLGYRLQNLPEEETPQLIQILKRRNGHMSQDGDEIELDIDALDTDTLWELYRFVANLSKVVNKTKLQGVTLGIPEANMGQVTDSVGKLKDSDEEYVDIDDVMPETTFPPVEIEKDEGVGTPEKDDRGNASSSSGSSSSDSSSSSGSDSGSSSDSGPDADDAQS